MATSELLMTEQDGSYDAEDFESEDYGSDDDDDGYEEGQGQDNTNEVNK